MGYSLISPFFLSTLFVSLLQTSSYAKKQSYVVYMGEHSYGANPTALDIDKAKVSHYDVLASCLQSKENAQTQMLYSYTRSINGFAAILDDAEAANLQQHPDVISVFLNRPRELHTTRSWNFLGLESNVEIPANSLWNKAGFGQDVIIANLDTGVWPDSQSFNDSGFGPVPSRWKGICQSDGGFRCNRKLIGARYFNQGFFADNGYQNDSRYHTARDNQGHGTHTLSTAGGGFVRGASESGFANGTAKGGSPKSCVAAYRVCWPSGAGSCYDADILAGFDAAIADGVDVISLSLGGGDREYYADSIAIGSFHAMTKGITVVASAGNAGPSPSTVSNAAPWFFTVGASTMDREFVSYVTLGNKQHYKGGSRSEKALPSGKFYPLISADEARSTNISALDASLCMPGTLDQKKVAGKIIVCLRGEISRPMKGAVAASAGAVGMILANGKPDGNDIQSDPHELPALNINYTDGDAVFSYINSTKNPIGTISPAQTELGIKSAPMMADFSSRGPSLLEPAILKPDITAPGVDVLAAYTGASDTQTVKTPFAILSGTSMSCPHVSGIVGLLKAVHRDWSPAAIRSAIMTTARTRGNDKKSIRDSTFLPASPFAYGAGQVQPNLVADPGLVYDLTPNDYLNYLCARGYNQSVIRGFSEVPYSCPKNFSLHDFNYPSITVTNLTGLVTVTRRVKNVGPAGTYTARVKAPKGVSVVVEPKSLTFTKAGEERNFKVTFKPLVNGTADNYVFGHLTWEDGKHRVRSPLVVNLV